MSDEDARRRGRVGGKIVLVTGGARGIGEAHVRKLVAEGAEVVFTDVRADLGHRLAEEVGPRARFVEADVTRQEDWNRAIAIAQDAFGTPTGLINNAGILVTGAVDDTTVEDYRRVVDVMQVGALLGMQAVLPGMRAAGSGSIVNISSIAGTVGFPDIVAYVASKWALRGMSKAAAIELGPAGIRVNSIHPGDIETPMIAGHEESDHVVSFESVPLGRFGKAEEVAALALFLISDEASYITGAEHMIDGGYTAA